MTVREQKLTNAGVPATEFAVKRTGVIVWSLAQIELGLAADAGEVAREIAVPDRAFAPGRAALTPHVEHGVLLAHEERLAGSVGDVLQPRLRLGGRELVTGVNLGVGVAHGSLAQRMVDDSVVELAAVAGVVPLRA